MPRRIRLTAALAILLGSVRLSAAEPPLQPDQIVGPNDPNWGCLKDIPVYCQEWHIWYGWPYPKPTWGVSHMNSTNTQFIEPWRLNWGWNAYPYPGPYDSRNPEIIRWQMRCMKAAGLESAVVMVHPTLAGGTVFVQEEPENNIQQILDLAAAEKFPVFFMDEVAFMRNDSRKPEVMTQRIVRFIKKYGAHPGFYKIDGKPVYYYQTFGFWLGKETTEKMQTEVEAQAGPVYWMVFGNVDEVGKLDRLGMVVCGAATHRQDKQTRRWNWSEQDQSKINETGHKYGKRMAELMHIKYENTSQPWRPPGVPAYGHHGDRLVKYVQNTLKAKSDFLMLSSWNDYEECTFLEPAWDADDFLGDPYFYCRLVAALKGREFVPPPPPAKEAVHPTIWEKIGYGDGAGPIIDRVRRANERAGVVEVIVRDTLSAVEALEVVWDGDLFWQAPQPYQEEPRGQLKPAAGELGPPEYLRSPLNHRFQIGRAAECLDPTLEFAAPEAAQLGPTPAVGVVYAFDQLNPLARITARLPVAEPLGNAGKQVDEVALRLGPHNVPADVTAEAWEGWQARVAVPVTPLAMDRPDARLKLDAQGRKLAHVALLGEPRPERCLTGGEAQDAQRLRVCFRIPIPIERLETPGVHCLWLRARDAAGNWGSPVLLALPNYEFPATPDESEKGSADRELKEKTGAVLASTFTPGGTAWHLKLAGGVKDSISTAMRRSAVEEHYADVGNGLYFSNLDRPLNGSFRLSCKMLQTTPQRCQMVWLTDAAGQKGYGFLWEYGSPEQFSGQGRIQLRKLNLDRELEWNDNGKELSGSAASGHAAVRPPFARFELRYDAQKGELQLWVDDQLRLSARDQEFREFGRVYLRANSRLLCDDVMVTPLEPAAEGK